MKKLFVLGLVSLALAGCGGKKEPPPQQPAQQPQPAQPTQPAQAQQQPVQEVKQAPPASSPMNISKEELTGAQWVAWQNNYEKSVSYRASDVGSKTGIWLKTVDKDDRDTEYKHYQTNCAGGPVIKDAEIEVEYGFFKRKGDYDVEDNPHKADAIRSLICR